jgi:hypothetical protein
MMVHIFSAHGPAQENTYFRQKEAELLDHLRSEKKLETERKRIEEAIGVTDQSILQDLWELGYTCDTVMLLPLVPLLQVAWADGELSCRETERIRELAHVRGLMEGTPAFDLLERWLSRKPTDEFFLKTLGVIRNLLSVLCPEELNVVKQDLISCCTYIAQGSGAILGLGNTIGAVEQKLLADIAIELEQKNHAAAREIVRQL